MPTPDAGQIGELFQEYTKYRHFREPSAMVTGAPMPAVQKDAPPGAECIELPDPAAPVLPAAAELRKLLASRRSRREFADAAVRLDELSLLLWATQGVTAMVAGHTLRTVPSAGARHPLETYLGACRIDGLEAGLYRYLPLQHRLVRLRSDKRIGRRFAQACLGQSMLADCGVVFCWSAVIERARWKYQQRAYRYIYLDAGHVCQNLYLACEALGLGCCAVAAFDDDAVNRLIDVDGKTEFVIYLAATGRRAE